MVAEDDDPAARAEQVEGRGETRLERLQLLVDRDPEGLEDPRGGMDPAADAGIARGDPLDEGGQLLTGTLMEYALPTAADVPAFELAHVEVPAENLLGVRGVGEGGTLGPPAALANAVADALAPLGVEVNELPITPARLWSRASSASARVL